MKISFKPWHGRPYKKYHILISNQGKIKYIGKMLAPNRELALVKARVNFPKHKNIKVKEKKY
jgi:1,2-phenylacetyl-CoA epoxidase PaaB subunit